MLYSSNLWKNLSFLLFYLDLSKFFFKLSSDSFLFMARYELCLRWKHMERHKPSLKKARRVSHLLLLMMVVVTRRLVRRSRKVVRSITLVVHHIQAAHSDKAQCSVRSSRRREERSLLRVHTGCTPGTVGASIYAQTHTMAMPSDNAPPAAHCAADTPGHAMDPNVRKCILKMRKRIFTTGLKYIRQVSASE